MGSLSQPRLNIFTVGNMRVMICLGQGGLRSLSASSSMYVLEREGTVALYAAPNPFLLNKICFN